MPRRHPHSSKPTGTTAAANPSSSESQWRKIVLRLVFGWLMIGSFLAIVYAGHIYTWLLVVLLQILIFRELVQVRYISAAEKNIPWFRSVQWCWFAVAMLYNYGDSLIEFIKSQEGISVPSIMLLYLQYHSWISFTLYAMLFVLSVLSLKKGYYKYQMGQFTWTVVTIGLIVGQMKYVLNNIFNGMFWLLFPASLVICNDCFAYFCGRLFGRKFIKATFLTISPNKTWEGFLGAFFFTLVFGFFFSFVLAQFTWLICPLQSFQLTREPLTCIPAAIFVKQLYDVPAWITTSSYWPFFTQFECLPIQLHSFVFSAFISLIAPFGGFFASAIKRTYGIKDFESMIPGHGGVMDRMDCQLITGLFTAVYYSTFLRNAVYATIPRILKLYQELSPEDQQKLVKLLSSTATCASGSTCDQ